MHSHYLNMDKRLLNEIVKLSAMDKNKKKELEKKVEALELRTDVYDAIVEDICASKKRKREYQYF